MVRVSVPTHYYIYADLLVLLAECIYHKQWLPANPQSSTTTQKSVGAATADGANGLKRTSDRLSVKDDAKLIFGTVFSLRNMVRKLGSRDDK